MADQETPNALAAVLKLVDSVAVMIFDFDGVIADTEPLHADAYVAMLRDYGIDFDRKNFSRYIGRSENQIYDMLDLEYGVEIDRAGAVPQRIATFLKLAESEGLQPFRYVRPLLEHAQRGGKRMYILSSQRPEVLVGLLMRWGLHDFFDRVFTVYDSVPPSTKHHLLPQVANVVGAEAPDIALFEDSAATLRLGRELQLRTIRVVHSMNRADTVETDAVIDTKNGR